MNIMGEDMSASKKLKEMTIHEASDFWDEHDFTEFKDVEEVKDIKFELHKKKYIGLDSELYKKVEHEAKRLHKSSEALIKEWLKEKVG